MSSLASQTSPRFIDFFGYKMIFSDEVNRLIDLAERERSVITDVLFSLFEGNKSCSKILQPRSAYFQRLLCCAEKLCGVSVDYDLVDKAEQE